jgi:hypothetical protein
MWGRGGHHPPPTTFGGGVGTGVQNSNFIDVVFL